MNIRLVGISKRFGNTAALDEIHMEVRSGELVALLGPSGSGKTTLLRTIAGLEPIQQNDGLVLFDGQDMRETPIQRRGTGFVFQNYALFQHMSVFENVAFGLRVLPRSARPKEALIRERVHELLRLVQLDGLEQRRPHQISGGQRQRVAFARALVVRPRVLLLDEPFGALDARVRQELRAWLRNLHGTVRTTTILVTHDQDEALEVADRVVVMDRGRIEQVGTPDELYHQPRTEFVASFLGTNNRLEARVRGRHLHFGGSQFPWHSCDGVGVTAVFVRPTQLELLRQPDHRPGFWAQIQHIQGAGASVRLELTLASRERIRVEITHDRHFEFGAKPGESVFAVPRQWRCFPRGSEESLGWGSAKPQGVSGSESLQIR